MYNSTVKLKGDDQYHTDMDTLELGAGGVELGGNDAGKAVVLEWVSQVVVKVVDGALASDNGLDEETEVGEHGKATVLDLLHLQPPNQCVKPLLSLNADGLHESTKQSSPLT